jgi:hypothetical protein
VCSLDSSDYVRMNIAKLIYVTMFLEETVRRTEASACDVYIQCVPMTIHVIYILEDEKCMI